MVAGGYYQAASAAPEALLHAWASERCQRSAVGLVE
jgi:hypothetical protein